PDRGDDQGAAHAGPVRIVSSRLEHRTVRFLAGALQPLDLGSLFPILGKDSRHRLRRYRARSLTSGVAAHPVANDEQGVEPRLVTPDDYSILILFTLETGIGRPCDPKPHQWPGWW